MEGYSDEASYKKGGSGSKNYNQLSGQKSNGMEVTSPLEMLEIIAEGGPHNISPKRFDEEISQNQDHNNYLSPNREMSNKVSQEDSQERMSAKSNRSNREPTQDNHEDTVEVEVNTHEQKKIEMNKEVQAYKDKKKQ